MAWFVVLGSGSWESLKVEAELHIRHRKGVGFFNGTTSVLDVPGHKVFRVMECATEAEADAALANTSTRHRTAPRDVIEQLHARSTTGEQGVK